MTAPTSSTGDASGELPVIGEEAYDRLCHALNEVLDCESGWGVDDLAKAAISIISRPTVDNTGEAMRAAKMEAVKQAADAVIGDLGQVDMDGYYNGVVHKSDVEHLTETLAALATPTPASTTGEEA